MNQGKAKPITVNGEDFAPTNPEPISLTAEYVSG
jgi:hypothetical protein